MTKPVNNIQKGDALMDIIIQQIVEKIIKSTNLNLDVFGRIEIH